MKYIAKQKEVDKFSQTAGAQKTGHVENFEHKPLSEELASVLWDLRRDRDDLVGELIAFSLLARDAYRAVSLMESNLKVHVGRSDAMAESKDALVHCKRIGAVVAELCMVEAFDGEREKKEIQKHTQQHNKEGVQKQHVRRRGESDSANLPKLLVKLDEYFERSSEIYHNVIRGVDGSEQRMREHGVKIFNHFHAIRRRLFELKVIVHTDIKKQYYDDSGKTVSPRPGAEPLETKSENIKIQKQNKVQHYQSCLISIID